MVSVEDYIARIDETCGEEKDLIVIFKYDKKDEAVEKILRKSERRKSVSPIVSELTFKGVSFRLYGTGKAIFRKLKGKNELHGILSDLLL